MERIEIGPPPSSLHGDHSGRDRDGRDRDGRDRDGRDSRRYSYPAERPLPSKYGKRIESIIGELEHKNSLGVNIVID